MTLIAISKILLFSVKTAFERNLGRHNVENVVAALVNEGEQPRTPIKQTRRRKKKCKKTDTENVLPAYSGGKADQEVMLVL